MLTITTTEKSLTILDQKYCRLILTEESSSHHRLVEAADGTLSYRLGAGKANAMTARSFRTLIRTIVQAAKSHHIEHLGIDYQTLRFDTLVTEYGEEWLASTIAENLLLAHYEFITYKKTKEKKTALKHIVIANLASKEAKTGIKRGMTVGEVTNEIRTIANTPASDMTPKDLALAATTMMKGTKVQVKILKEAELKKLKMNTLLAVGHGAEHKSHLIIAEYWGAGKPAGKKIAQNKKPLVLIGKGVTYDTGGLNVKPSGSMHEMHMDMSGGATVLGAIKIAAALGIKKNIVAIVPAAENAISERSMRAGDIVTAMNGKTIEILHTDAEGRLILADALTYSERYAPKVILDVATLTGAALVALGQHASAIMTKDKQLQDTLVALGEKSGDLTWPLPLWDEYQQYLKSYRADLSNIATNFSRYGGSIEGGTFLSFFAPKDVPWAHIDMAPRMDSIASDKLAKGATGEPVRLLVSFLEQG